MPRSFVSEHDVRGGFKPKHNRFSLWKMARRFLIIVPAARGDGVNSPRRLVGTGWSASERGLIYAVWYGNTPTDGR